MTHFLSEGQHGAPASAEKKKEDKKQTLLVLVGVAGVGLTYLLYRRSRSSPTAASTATPQDLGAGASDGTGGTSSPNQSDLLNAIGSEFGSLQQTIAALQAQQAADEAKLAQLGQSGPGGGTVGTPGSGPSWTYNPANGAWSYGGVSVNPTQGIGPDAGIVLPSGAKAPAGLPPGTEYGLSSVSVPTGAGLNPSTWDTTPGGVGWLSDPNSLNNLVASTKATLAAEESGTATATAGSKK